MLVTNLFDATPFLDFILHEMAYQELHGWDPDLGDHRSGDLFADFDEWDDLS